MNLEDIEVFNKFKFCPICGQEKIYKKSDKSIQCSDCSFMYYINSAAAVAGLIFDDTDKLLLTIRGRDPMKGMLDLPGGFIDLAESAENALRREIREELNSEIKKIIYLDSQPNIYPFGGILYHTLDIFFKCSLEENAEIKADDDIDGFIFIKPDEIDIEKIAFISVKNVLKKILKK